PPRSLLTHPASPHISPLSLHDALPISTLRRATCSPKRGKPSLGPWQAGSLTGAVASERVTEARAWCPQCGRYSHAESVTAEGRLDRKSTRLNSSHQIISYAVFCLKKKK